MATLIDQEIISFSDLKVEQEDAALTRGVNAICAELLKEELYSSAGRIKRASVSVSSNLAKGFSAEHRSGHRQFAYLAVKSLAQLEMQIRIADQRKFLIGPAKNSIFTRIARLRAMLITLGREPS